MLNVGSDRENVAPTIYRGRPALDVLAADSNAASIGAGIWNHCVRVRLYPNLR